MTSIRQEVTVKVYETATDLPSAFERFLGGVAEHWLWIVAGLLGIAVLVFVIIIIKRFRRVPHFWRNFAVVTVFSALAIGGALQIHFNQTRLGILRPNITIEVVKDTSTSGRALSTVTSRGSAATGGGFDLYADQTQGLVAQGTWWQGSLASAVDGLDDGIELALVTTDGERFVADEDGRVLLASVYGAAQTSLDYDVEVIVAANTPAGTYAGAIDYTAEDRDTLISASKAAQAFTSSDYSDLSNRSVKWYLTKLTGTDPTVDANGNTSDEPLTNYRKVLEYTTSRQVFEPTARYTLKNFNRPIIDPAHPDENAAKNDTEAVKTHRWLNAPDPIRREYIRSIKFEDASPSGGTDEQFCWDVSANQQGTIEACYSFNIFATALIPAFDITIRQTGGVSANADSSYLFYYVGRNDIDEDDQDAIADKIEEENALQESAGSGGSSQGAQLEECAWFDLLCHGRNGLSVLGDWIVSTFESIVEWVALTIAAIEAAAEAMREQLILAMAEGAASTNYTQIDLRNLHTEATTDLRFTFAGAKFMNMSEQLELEDLVPGIGDAFESGSGEGACRAMASGNGVLANSLVYQQCMMLVGPLLERYDSYEAAQQDLMYPAAFPANGSGWQLNTDKVTMMSSMFAKTGSSNDSESGGAVKFNFTTTANVQDFSRMFEGSFFSRLDLSNFNTSTATDMHNMFANTQKLDPELNDSVAAVFTRLGIDTSNPLDLSSFDTSKVTNMSSMFLLCAAPSINVSSFDTSKVTDMGSMFSWTNMEGEIDLNHFKTSKVGNMRDMFANSQFERINIEEFDVSRVANLQGMFAASGAMRENSEPQKLALPNPFRSDEAWNFKWMFGLSNVEVEGSGGLALSTKSATDMSYMFYAAQHTKMVDFSATDGEGKYYFDTSQVEDMSWMFANYKVRYGCQRGISVVDGLPTETNLDSPDCNLYEDGSGVVEAYDIDYSVDTYAPDELLDLGGELNADGTEENEELIEAKKAESVYSKDPLDLTSFNTEKVKTMQGMFVGSNAKYAKVNPGFVAPNTKDTSWMFAGMKDKSFGEALLDPERMDTTGIETMEGMFSGISSRNRLTLDIFATESAEDMNWMFAQNKFGCIQAGGSFVLASEQRFLFNDGRTTELKFLPDECPETTYSEGGTGEGNGDVVSVATPPGVSGLVRNVEGLDCSDCVRFVNSVYKKAGLPMPLTGFQDGCGAANGGSGVADMLGGYNYCVGFSPTTSPGPGDVIVYPGRHVAIYLGNGKVSEGNADYVGTCNINSSPVLSGGELYLHYIGN
jgi:surface protein